MLKIMEILPEAFGELSKVRSVLKADTVSLRTSLSGTFSVCVCVCVCVARVGVTSDSVCVTDCVCVCVCVCV